MKPIFARMVLSLLLFYPATTGFSQDRERAPSLKGPYFGQELPGLEPRLFAPGLVSTPEGLEFGLSLSPDGKQIYFTRMVPGTTMKALVSRLEKDGWTDPRESTYLSNYQAASPRFSKDGRSIYFTSRMPEGKLGKATEKPALLFAQITGTEWSAPRSVGFPEGWVSAYWNPVMASDGYIYFNGKSQDHPSKYDDILRVRLEEEKYTKVERLRLISHEDAMDGEPAISPDGSYMLFYSAGRPGNLSEEMLGDLWISFRRKDGVWSAPRNMGEGINSRDEENWPRFSPDGRYIFFSSNRNRKNGFPDIYWVSAKVVEKLR
jgi:dipeptidyl aminopeptidase/acylaminoacyl peptidase